MPEGLHEDAAVRAMQVHARVPCWRLRPLCEGWKPDLPLWQGNPHSLSLEMPITSLNDCPAVKQHLPGCTDIAAPQRRGIIGILGCERWIGTEGVCSAGAAH